MNPIGARFHQWRHDLGIAWLLRSTAVVYRQPKERFMRMLWGLSRCAWPAFQGGTSLALAFWAAGLVQSPERPQGDVVLVFLVVLAIAVIMWGVYELTTTHTTFSHDEPLRSTRTKVGDWLMGPFRLFDDRGKGGLARRLNALERNSGLVIHLYPLEARCLQLLLAGLTHHKMRQNWLDVALPAPANDPPPKSRF